MIYFTERELKNSDADGMSKAVRAVFSNEAPDYVTTLPSLKINIIEATEEPGQNLTQLELREIIRRTQRQYPLVERWRKAGWTNNLYKET